LPDGGKPVEPLALRGTRAHIRPMIERPCRANTDLKQIWRLLLPDTPFPACGPSESSDAEAADHPPPAPASEIPLSNSGDR
jgi:hypothetical protein